MVVEELGQEAGREGPHLPRVGRPHGRRLGHDQPVDERPREALLLEPVAERRALALLERSSSRAARWKRTTSATMRWNHGVARCARLANSPLGEVLAYSKSPRSSLTPKLMSDGCDGDAEPVEQALEVRVVAVVEDDEAGVDVVGLVRGVDAHGVRVAARVTPASNTVTSCSRWSRWAATRPEMPAPTIATFTLLACL